MATYKISNSVISYSDGDEVEKKLLSYVKEQRQLSQEDSLSWELLYHLSSFRENILNWYPFKSNCTVLEIGAGCGAITGLLCKKASHVVSIEGSLNRAEILFERYKNIDNLSIVATDINNYSSLEKFDYVVLNGVLEYVECYRKCDNPYGSFLEHIKSFLKIDGTILLAIENKYGIKYFSGSNEDHLGKSFIGINDYKGCTGVRTFSRQELESLLDSINFKHRKWYYPYPDYKFPFEIFTDASINLRYPSGLDLPLDYNQISLFDKNIVYRQYIDNNVAHVFSNSFLLEISLNEIDNNIDYVKISNNRRKEFSLFTVLDYTNGFVTKRALHIEGHNHLIKMESNRIGSKNFSSQKYEWQDNALKCKFLKEKNLLQLLNEAAIHNDKELFWNLIEQLKRCIFDNSVNKTNYNKEFCAVFGLEQCAEKLHWVNNANIDLIPDNIFIVNDKWVSIDNEWIFNFAIPAEYIFWRVFIHSFFNEKARGFLDSIDLLSYIQINKNIEKVFKKWENHFLSNYIGSMQIQYKVDKRIDLSNLFVDYHQLQKNEKQLIKEKNQLVENNNQLVENNNQLVENNNQLVENNNQLVEEKNHLVEINRQISFQNSEAQANIAYLNELAYQYQNTINMFEDSRFWRLTEPFRIFLNKAKRTKLASIYLKKKRISNLEKAIHDRPYDCLSEKMQLSSILLENAKQKNNFHYNPLVTVVIPVYDRTKVLIESIESILNQTYSNIEIIAVCDGSPDDTLKIVKGYETAGKIRAFYYSDNSGNAVRGRNKAILEAKGDYLAFQDSDDVAELDRIENSLNYMLGNNADIVYGSWRAIIDGTRNIDGIENGQIITSPDCDLDLLRKICVPCQSTVMADIGALRMVGGLKTQMKYREDHELWLRLAYSGFKFKSINKVLTNLRLHKNNLELKYKCDDQYWYQQTIKEYSIINNSKPFIAYLIPGCGISGGIAVICQHVNRLRKRGYRTILITEDESNSINWFPRQKVDIVHYSQAPRDIDILVATGWSTAYTATKIKAKRKYYFVQSDESRFFEYNSKEYWRAIETYKMDFSYFTEAKWIQKWLRDEYGHDSDYVPNGIDNEIISDIIGCHNQTKKVRVLLEGPIDIPFKGMENAFKAIENLDCEVWCVSSAGVPKPNWKCDRFFSRLNFNEMKYVYSSCDIFLKMSEVEGFFGPPMEMMACHGACVVSKVTGYDEYIIDGYNALVVEKGDVKAAHNAVKRLIDDIQFRKKISNNGYKTAMEWKWETSIDKLETIFNL